MDIFDLIKNVQYSSNLSASYVIEGRPQSLSRPRFANGIVYDSQKDIKTRTGLELKNQHELPLFTGALKLDVIFYMQVPDSMKRKRKDDVSYTPHCKKPDIDNLIKFVLDCSNGILFEDDSQIAIINASKIYSMLGRTEFTITQL